MKKCLLALALCAFAFGSEASILQTYNSPKDGDSVKIRNGGRLASVDVFSTEPSGTVKISRVFSMDVFTNAYDIATDVVTNVIEHEVWAGHYREDESGDLFFGVMNWSDPHGSPTSYKNWTYLFTNCVNYSERNTLGFSHYGDYWGMPSNIWTYGMTYENRNQDGEWADHVTLRNTIGNTMSFSFVDKFIDHYDFETNIVTVVTTNSIDRVFSRNLSVTNDIFSGSCSNNCMHAKPDPEVWLFPNDNIIFKGTATGGALRMVIE